MSIRIRLFMIFAATTAFSVLFGAAGLVGRGSASPIAAVQIDERGPDSVAYLLIDIERRLISERSLNVPDVVDSRWYAQPPLVLQRTTRDGFADWVLSAVDLTHNLLSPVMRLTTSNNVRIRIPDFVTRERPDGKFHPTVYVPLSGEIWTATPDNSDADLVTVAQRGLNYPLSLSPDSTMMAVNGMGELLVVNADGSNRRRFEGVQTQAWVTWSPDNHRLLLSPIDLYSRESARAIELQTGRQIILPDARLAISCETGYVAITEHADGFGITHISENGESRTILDAATLNGLEPAGILQLEGQRCERLVILNRRGEGLLVHTGSGETVPLGNGIRIVSVDDGLMLYQAQAGDVTEIRRLALDSGAQPELLWQYPRTFAEIRWLDDATRGLFIDTGRLTLLDIRRPFTVALTGPVARAFSIVE